MMSSFLTLSGRADNISVEKLASDVKALQAELLEVRLEIQASNVSRLKGELAAAQKNRQRQELRERSVYGEVAIMDRQLSAPDITPEQHAELEVQRKELAGTTSAELRQHRLEAEQKESEIGKQLHLAIQKLSSLMDRSKQ